MSITRCAAECDTPNNGPICRIVKFVRQYVDQQHPIRQLQTPRPTTPAISDLRPTTLGHDRDQFPELTWPQTREREDPLRPRRGDHLHHQMINYLLDQPISTHPDLRDIT